MKILTGFAVIKDSIGYRITYTYSEVDEKGIIIASNSKESFIVMDEEVKGLIGKLEAKIAERL
ncbi:hypothetical protein PMY12_14870 [Clostridium tertium]|uniref:hypothetical protein n=1 Tax=Clostridium tertium TaxID=1559 RepID=UPI00232BC0E3|nr:hypothetical protein [Clostridium tertium]MDB1931667.1 hypothetical protein [Clostridium tertium]MDB1938287.1 hypothetical protein [Clostridium tertium]MDI9216036.1 hypothetical protein [Clostridium tertium]